MTRSRSSFAAALARLLDETSHFTRAEWARFLGVSTSAISQWVNDKTVPRADLLRMILDVLRTSRGVPPEPLAEFEVITLRPAQEVSPLGARMLPTVGEYLRTSTFAAFGRELRRLSPEQQEKVLTDGSWGPGGPGDGPVSSGLHYPLVELPGTAKYGREQIDTTLLPHLERLQGAQPPTRIPWDALFSSRAVLVIGTAGSGKTAIIATLAQAFRKQMHVLPIFIRAGARWSQEGGATLLQLCESATRNNPGPILVDGLDEIPAERRALAADEISEVACRLPAAQVFVASRPVPELSLLQGFESFSVAPLSSFQVMLWLGKAVERSDTPQLVDSDELERFVCHLTERRALHRSLRNPLFLSSTWTLFLRNAVTPFAEAELLGEFARRLLDEWDRERNVIRAREPWASPHNLSTILGELCFYLVHSRKEEFHTKDVEGWIGNRLRNVPCDRLLSLLSVQSGILIENGPSRWRISHEYLRHYFAAAHVVESSGSARQYLGDWTHREDIRDVFRLACGITSDATPLLQAVLEATNALEADRSLLLAEILAQPVVAVPEVVAASCDAMVTWLDAALKHWSIESGSTEDWEVLEFEPLWKLYASGMAKEKYDGWVSRVLSALHRARSGPARQALMERLDKVVSPVLSKFADSLQVEGRLHLEFEPRATKRILRAAVVAPGFA